MSPLDSEGVNAPRDDESEVPLEGGDRAHDESTDDASEVEEEDGEPAEGDEQAEAGLTEEAGTGEIPIPGWQSLLQDKQMVFGILTGVFALVFAMSLMRGCGGTDDGPERASERSSGSKEASRSSRNRVEKPTHDRTPEPPRRRELPPEAFGVLLGETRMRAGDSILVGELADLKFTVDLAHAQSPGNGRWVVCWSIGRGGNEYSVDFCEAGAPEVIKNAAWEAARKWKLPLEVRLAAGYLADGDTTPTRTAAEVVCHIGFPLDVGLVYPAPNDVEDAKHGEQWYATAYRPCDDAYVSVFRRGNVWWYVDQQQVTVERYLDRFLPQGLRLLGEQCERFEVPPRIHTFAAFSTHPEQRTEPVEPRNASTAAALLAKGPLFYNRSPLQEEAWLRAYPTPALSGFSITVPKESLGADGDTGPLPVIGISFIEAASYMSWVSSQTGGSWSLWEPDSYAAVVEAAGPLPAPGETDGPRRADAVELAAGCGLFGLTGNLMEFGMPDASGQVPLFGSTYFGTTSVDPLKPFARPVQAGFRLHIRQEVR